MASRTGRNCSQIMLPSIHSNNFFYFFFLKPATRGACLLYFKKLNWRESFFFPLTRSKPNLIIFFFFKICYFFLNPSTVHIGTHTVSPSLKCTVWVYKNFCNIFSFFPTLHPTTNFSFLQYIVNFAFYIIPFIHNRLLCKSNVFLLTKWIFEVFFF